jgi:hypothetical protein
MPMVGLAHAVNWPSARSARIVARACSSAAANRGRSHPGTSAVAARADDGPRCAGPQESEAAPAVQHPEPESDLGRQGEPRASEPRSMMSQLTWSALILAALAAVAGWASEDRPACVACRPVFGASACCERHKAEAATSVIAEAARRAS